MFIKVLITIFAFLLQPTAAFQNHSLLWRSSVDYKDRILFFSESFLNRPYLLNPLGEGQFDEIDQDPIYRFDYFDCITYIETVIALAFSHSHKSFLKQIVNLRYKDGLISYFNRLHFVELNWLSNGSQKGIFYDSTKQLFSNLVEEKIVNINVPNWYKTTDLEKIGKSSLDSEKRKIRLNELANFSQKEDAHLSYLPKNKILSNPDLLNRIPDASILFIVSRSNELERRKTGSNIAVTHVGFVIKKNNRIIFRNASSRKATNRVIDEDLFELISSQRRFRNLIGIQVATFHFGL
jgi:hypothetical protein